MADPLSPAASVIALLVLAKEVVNYLRGVRDAPDDRRKITAELASITAVLEILKDQLNETQNPGSPQFAAITALYTSQGPLCQLEDMLKLLRARLATKSGIRKVSEKLTWPFRKSEALEILTSIERLKSLFILALENDELKLLRAVNTWTHDTYRSVSLLHVSVDEIKATQVGKYLTDREARSRRAELEKVVSWLSPINSWATQSRIHASHEKGTGEWFLRRSEFREWLSGSRNVLWCRGIPGAGKTVIASITTEYLRTTFQEVRNVGIASVYCNYKEMDIQSPLNLIASLCAQLLMKRGAISDGLRALYSRHTHLGIRPTLEDISQILLAEVTLNTATYIIVDAVDECPTSDGIRATLISRLSEFASKFNLMLLSRHHFDVLDDFKEAACIEISAQEEDIRLYLHRKTPLLAKCVQRNEPIQKQIADSIVEVLGGMFLLARFHLESLVDKVTLRKVKDALKNFPVGSNSAELQCAYRDALRRVDEQLQGYRTTANDVFSFVVASRRPITVDELRYFLAVNPGDTECDEDSIPDKDVLTSYCAGLVVIDDESRTVRFVHKTTHEFCQSIYDSRFRGAHAMIAKRSLTYLSFPIFKGGLCRTPEAMTKVFRDHPFCRYAVEELGMHASRELDGDVDEAIVCLLQKDCLPSIAQILFLDYDGAFSMPYLRSLFDLQIAVQLGIERICSKLLTAYHKIDRRDMLDETALHIAARAGCTAMALEA